MKYCTIFAIYSASSFLEGLESFTFMLFYVIWQLTVLVSLKKKKDLVDFWSFYKLMMED